VVVEMINAIDEATGGRWMPVALAPAVGRLQKAVR
jgi:hypothetical protein